MPEFPHKVILISGAARGIGKAIAKLFAEKGWYLALLDIDNTTLTETALEFPEDRRCYIQCDVTKDEDIQKALQYVGDRTNGRIDLLINNAGLMEVGDFDQVSLDAQMKVIDVNLSGVVRLTYHAAPYLKQTPNSQIINLSSASALIGNPELSIYAATKAAVKSLTEGWHISFRKHDVRVSDLLPFYVRTDMTRSNYSKFSLLNDQKVKLKPENIARVVWKASKKNRIHWYVGANTKLFAILVGLLPMRWKVPILKSVINYKSS